MVPLVSESEEEIRALGSITDIDCIPVECLMKVMCRRFLLAGKPGELIGDRQVRVSMKTLALGCLSSAVIFRPQLLFLSLSKEPSEGKCNTG